MPLLLAMTPAMFIFLSLLAHAHAHVPVQLLCHKESYTHMYVYGNMLAIYNA